MNSPATLSEYALVVFGLFRLLALGLLLYGSLGALVVSRRLRRPPRRTYAWAASRGRPGDPSEVPPPLGPLAFRSFTFSPGEGKPELPAWEIQGARTGDPRAPMVILTPGWGDSKVGALTRLAPVVPNASRIIAWDPSGQGEAPGLCGLGTQRDVTALVALVHATTDSAGRQPPIVLMGWSMGAGISIAAAAMLAEAGTRVSAVVAEAPYRLPETPVRNYLRLVNMPTWWTVPMARLWLRSTIPGSNGFRDFDRVGWASRLQSPLLVIHGSADDICPVDDGRAIAAAASRALFIAIENAGHNDLWTSEPFRTQCERAVSDFLLAVESGTAAA